MKPEHKRVLSALPARREDLPGLTGLGVRTVGPALKALTKRGLVRWVEEPGAAPEWRLTAEGELELLVQGPKHPWLLGAECGDCPLRAGCAAVPPTLPDVAGRRVLFVGEAPAAEEERAGRPFVGRSGKLLDRVLEEVGLDRAQLGLTNAVACVLPWSGERSGPPATAMKACQGFLATQVAAWQPELIVALGAPAAKTLTGQGRITALHGVTLPGAGPFEGTPVLCAYHPAHVLRNERLYGTLRADVSLVLAPRVQVSEHFEVEIVDRPLLPSGVEVAVDIETPDLGRYSGVVSVAFAFEPNRAQVVLDPQPGTFEGLVNNRWVYHHGMFDVPRLRRAGWTEARCDDDTMLMAHAVDERADHRLEYLATVLLEAGDYKAAARGSGGSGKYQPTGLPARELAQLNGMDACYTLRLLDPLRASMEAEGTERAYRLMVDSMDPLLEMESNGMLLDLEALAVAGTELEAELGTAHGEFRMLADVLGSGVERWRAMASRHNYNAPAAMAALFDGLGLLGRKKSTDAKALSGMVERGEEPGASLARRLIQCRHLYRLLSSYVRKFPGLVGADGRLRTVYKPTGTETGRLASGDRQLGAPNLQNVAGHLKHCFVAAPGHRLVNVDLSQAEIRTLAHFARDPELDARLAGGEDTHKAMASIIWGIPVDAVTKEQRSHAKQLNFGILYGRGENAIAAELGIPVLEARAIIETYYRRLPQVGRWKRQVEEGALRDGYVTYSLGRRRHFAGLEEAKVRRESCNTVIQGTASDIVLAALPVLYQGLRGVEGARLVATVHDSVVIEAEESIAAAVGEYARAVLVDTPRRVFGMQVPFRADVEVSERWG